MKLKCADLDGDGKPEVLALVCVDEYAIKGNRRISGKNMSKLCVLNSEGNVLAVKHLPLYTNIFLDVVPVSGQKPAIVVIGGGRIWKLEYHAGAGTLSGAESAGADASR